MPFGAIEEKLEGSAEKAEGYTEYKVVEKKADNISVESAEVGFDIRRYQVEAVSTSRDEVEVRLGLMGMVQRRQS